MANNRTLYDDIYMTNQTSQVKAIMWSGDSTDIVKVNRLIGKENIKKFITNRDTGKMTLAIDSGHGLTMAEPGYMIVTTPYQHCYAIPKMYFDIYHKGTSHDYYTNQQKDYMTWKHLNPGQPLEKFLTVKKEYSEWKYKNPGKTFEQYLMWGRG